MQQTWNCTVGREHTHTTIQGVLQHEGREIARKQRYWARAKEQEKTFRDTKPVPGERFKRALSKAPWIALLPVVTDLKVLGAFMAEFEPLPPIPPIECVLYPDIFYEGKKYSIHTCNYHEYIIIEWTND